MPRSFSVGLNLTETSLLAFTACNKTWLGRVWQCTMQEFRDSVF